MRTVTEQVSRKDFPRIFQDAAFLLQNAMFIAGIATLIQLYPIWKIGSRLPIVMGVSFTFVAILTYVGATYDSWVQF